ncbi:hypothetical protein RhiirA4_460578 [Rhizophagus irregularis]|uniref:Uncharacterized protein n=1 Tax=Rhizophagus irregularis TaxID=588596 RepID=A0A2I1GGY9_9GLOM|nr:hypothetical protein RhiirA4_460578 [Rhizophagus irregularis]
MNTSGIALKYSLSLCPFSQNITINLKHSSLRNQIHYTLCIQIPSHVTPPIFKWTKKLPKQILDVPELHCLLMNFVPSHLTYPFKAAKISKDTTKRILLKFLFDLHKEIYENIWKHMTVVNKRFFNYRQGSTTYHHRKDMLNINNNNGYHCPLNDCKRQIDNNNLWIYLTSSNFLHNLPWLSSLNEDLELRTGKGQFG